MTKEQRIHARLAAHHKRMEELIAQGMDRMEASKQAFRESKFAAWPTSDDKDRHINNENL